MCSLWRWPHTSEVLSQCCDRTCLLSLLHARSRKVNTLWGTFLGQWKLQMVPYCGVGSHREKVSLRQASVVSGYLFSLNPDSALLPGKNSGGIPFIFKPYPMQMPHQRDLSFLCTTALEKQILVHDQEILLRSSCITVHSRWLIGMKDMGYKGETGHCIHIWATEPGLPNSRRAYFLFLP